MRTCLCVCVRSSDKQGLLRWARRPTTPSAAEQKNHENRLHTRKSSKQRKGRSDTCTSFFSIKFLIKFVACPGARCCRTFISLVERRVSPGGPEREMKRHLPAALGGSFRILRRRQHRLIVQSALIGHSCQMYHIAIPYGTLRALRCLCLSPPPCCVSSCFFEHH